MKNRAKLLFIMHDFSRGGIQSFTWHLINALPKDRYESHILYYNDVTSMKSAFETLVTSITYFSNFRISRRFFAFRNVIKTINPDMVHFQGHEGMFTMLLWLRLLGLPVVNTFHSTHFDEISTPERIKETLAQFCVVKIVHVARESEIRYSRTFRTMPGKHITIYNGIDVDAVRQRKEKFTRLPGWESGIHIVSVANFHPQKGYDKGIRAVADLCNRFPNITYHILGGSHTSKDVENRVRAFVVEHRLGHRIILHGEQQDVIPFLSSADIFFSPSDKELMPLSFLEAMACGLPMVATKTGGVPEILGEREEWGIVGDVANMEQMKTALSRLIVDPKLRTEMGRRSFYRANFFAIQAIRDKYTELFDDVLTKRKPSLADPTR